MRVAPPGWGLRDPVLPDLGSPRTDLRLPEGRRLRPRARPDHEGWPEVATTTQRSRPAGGARWPTTRSASTGVPGPTSAHDGRRELPARCGNGPDQQGDLSLDALITHNAGHAEHDDVQDRRRRPSGRISSPRGRRGPEQRLRAGRQLDVRGDPATASRHPSERQRRVRGGGRAPHPLDGSKLATEQQDKRTRRLESRPKGDNDRPPPKNLSPRAHGYIDGALRRCRQGGERRPPMVSVTTS